MSSLAQKSEMLTNFIMPIYEHYTNVEDFNIARCDSIKLLCSNIEHIIEQSKDEDNYLLYINPIVTTILDIMDKLIKVTEIDDRIDDKKKEALLLFYKKTVEHLVALKSLCDQKIK